MTRYQPPRILVVGASARAAAQRSSMSGFAVWAIDQFADRDLLACARVSPSNSLTEIDEAWWRSLEGVPLLPSGGLENHPDSLAFLMRRGIQCGLQPGMLASLRSPEVWAVWAATSGLGWPETWLPNCGESMPIADGAWWVKSQRSAGGLGVRPWRGESLAESQYLQRYIDGEVLGVSFVSDSQASRAVGCMRSWATELSTAPMPCLYRGSIGPIFLTVSELAPLERFANTVREQTGLRGLWQADFIRDREGWWLLEINPRWSGSMELLDACRGGGLVADHAAAVSGGSPDAWHAVDDASRSLACAFELATILGKRIWYAQTLMRPDRTTLESWWERRWDGNLESLREGNRLADIPATAGPFAAGDPVFSEFAVGSTMEEVRAKLQAPSMGIDGACCGSLH